MSQQINLYNPLLLKQQKLFSLRTMTQALGLILLGNFLFYGYASYRTANLEKQATQTTKLYNTTLAQFERTKGESGPRSPSALLADEVARTEAQLKTRRRIIGLLEQGAGVFRLFSRALAADDGRLVADRFPGFWRWRSSDQWSRAQARTGAGLYQSVETGAGIGGQNFCKS